MHARQPDLLLATLVALLVALPPVSKAQSRDQACERAVQGKIAWNYDGSKRWASTNVDRLCEGAKDSTEPAKCFRRVMHGGVDWGGGTRWEWENALDLCRGTLDAAGTVRCFEQRVDQLGWRQAADSCRWDTAGGDDTKDESGDTGPIVLDRVPGAALGLVGPRPFTGRGTTDCEDDDAGCNMCVAGVERQFERLAIRPGKNSRSPSGRFRVNRNKNAMLPPDPADRMPNIKFRKGQHVQGFSRVDTGDNKWFVMSNGSNRKDAGFGMIDLGRTVPNRGGDRIVRADQNRDSYKSSKPPAGMAVRFYYPVGGPDSGQALKTDHPGGMQVVGRLVFVPYKAEGRGRVDIWDLTAPTRGEFIQTVTLPNWCEGDPSSCDSNRNGALYVAAAKMDNGHYVMMVNRGDNGQTTVLTSGTSEIAPSTEWNVVDSPRLGGDYHTGRSAYQNANFVTDCSSGRLYLVALRQQLLWDSDNVAHLFRAGSDSGDDDGALRLSRVNRIEPDGSDGDWCDLRGGGGMYVTPGNEMILYCSQGRDVRGNGSYLKFSEHTVN